MRRILIISVVICISQVAAAFHKMICTNTDQTISACYLSDAPFGFIFSSYIIYQNKTVVYTTFSAGDPVNHQTPDGNAVINFCSGNKLVIFPTESSAVLESPGGKSLAQLNCQLSLSTPGKCTDLTPGGLPNTPIGCP